MNPKNKIKAKRFILAFSISAFALSIILMGAVLYAVPEAMVPGTREEPEQEESGVFLPDASQCMNLLVVGQSSEEGADTFVILRFDPVNGAIPILVLPRETFLLNGENPDTLENVYDKGGIVYTAQVLSENLEIPIDRYARLDLKGYLEIADAVGTVQFDLPYEITYQEGGAPITLHVGTQLLDGRKTAALIGKTDYEDGEIQRCALTASLISAIINQRIDVALSTAADSLFSMAVNVSDTNVGINDYINLKEAAQFMAQLSEMPSAPLELNGSYNDSRNTYTLSDGFKAQIKQTFQ